MSDQEIIQLLRSELERLRDLVTEADVESIDAVLAAVDAQKERSVG